MRLRRRDGGGKTHRQVMDGRFIGRSHAPSDALVAFVPFRADERPAFRGCPCARALSARHARDPYLVSHRRFSQFLSRRARRRAARRVGARALARAPKASSCPHSPSDDTHRASDAAEECRAMTLDTRKKALAGREHVRSRSRDSLGAPQPKRGADTNRKLQNISRIPKAPVEVYRRVIPPAYDVSSFSRGGERFFRYQKVSGSATGVPCAHARPNAGRPVSARRVIESARGAAKRVSRIGSPPWCAPRARMTRGTPSRTQAT